MENKNNKVLYYGLGAVLFIVLIIFLSTRKNNVDTTANVDQTVPASTEDTSAGSINTKNAPAISYADALAKYKDARIQLDKMCQATPNYVTYKNNTSIMIDNRSDVVRTVKVGTDYSVKGYGFKIIKISSTKLPTTWLVDCDKSQNVATILIQK